MTHICEVCFQPSETHSEECEEGCCHWPPLCCKGCRCGSFERAHNPVPEKPIVVE